MTLMEPPVQNINEVLTFFTDTKIEIKNFVSEEELISLKTEENLFSFLLTLNLLKVIEDPSNYKCEIQRNVFIIEPIDPQIGSFAIRKSFKIVEILETSIDDDLYERAKSDINDTIPARQILKSIIKVKAKIDLGLGVIHLCTLTRRNIR